MARRRSCDFSRIEQAGVYPSLLLLRVCFLLDLVLQLLLKLLLLSRSAHGHAVRLKILHPLRTERVPTFVFLSRGFSCCCTSQPPQVLPSLRAPTPPPSESSDDGVAQHPSMLHRWWAAIDAHRTLLVHRLRCGSLSQPVHREQGAAPISSPMKLHRSLL